MLTGVVSLQLPIVLMTGASRATKILLSSPRRRRPGLTSSAAGVGPGSATVAMGAQVPVELEDEDDEVLEVEMLVGLVG